MPFATVACLTMGTAGTDALETADVVLTTDDLGKIAHAVSLGRARPAGVKLGRIKLPTGVAGHEGSTLLVMLNGLRLLTRFRPSRRTCEDR